MYDARLILKRVFATPAPAFRGFGSLVSSALVIVFCTGCAAPSHAADQDRPAGDAVETPDAVYEVWDQVWGLDADGATYYHERRHVRLNSDRVFRQFGNPRITYNTDTDEVEVLVARVRLPDGSYVELEDYSTVGVTPDGSAGWPTFANIRQKVMVMGGIEPGCVLELEHKIKTKAGVQPYLAADVRIDNRYPVRSHKVSVTLPGGTELSPIVAGLPEDGYVYNFQQSDHGGGRHRWVFPALPGQPNEPRGLPWRERGVRLAFTTAPDAETWINQILATVDEAAGESPLLSRLAQQWTEEAGAESDKLGVLQRKLAASFNFVDFDTAWRPAKPRLAADVVHNNYGLPAESAAVLLALARTAGVAARPGLLVANGVWEDGAPQAAMVAAYVVVRDGPDGLEIWHPRHGRIQRDKRWANHTLLHASGDKIVRTTLPAWNSAGDSRCAITGSVTIADDGTYAAKLSIKTSGLFVSPNALETRDGQKSRIKSIVNHLLPDAKVASFTLKSLAPQMFEAEVEVESNETLEKLHECYQFELAETSPALADVSTPLAHSRRLTAARLAGAFDERIELSITWPEAWETKAVPSSLEEDNGGWGKVVQTVDPTEHGLRLVRHTIVAAQDLSPDDVITLRKPLNELRSDYARTLLLEPQ